jgi:hypothetical protein
MTTKIKQDQKIAAFGSSYRCTQNPVGAAEGCDLFCIVYAYFSLMRDERFMDDPVDNNKPPTFWQMLHSVLAAAFGVQSGKNRARDFTHGKPSHFVILGILFTAVFALTLFGIVKLVLHLAGI